MNPDAHTKIWVASENSNRKGKKKVGEEEVEFLGESEVNTVDRLWHGR